jgi:hypothetical protein
MKIQQPGPWNLRMDQVLIDGVAETVDDHRRNQKRHEKLKILTPKD